MREDPDLKKWADRYNGILWSDEIPWLTESRILKPLSLPHTIKNVNRKNIKRLLYKSRSILAYWTDQWNREESLWWWISCDDKEYDVERIVDKGGRRDVRKGLRECSIKRMKPDDFVNLTYPVYSEAYNSYKYHNLRNFSKDQYREYIFNKSKYEGYELWGAFVGDKFAAYASTVLMDDAVLLESARSDPALQRHCPNNALFYSMTKHYLGERDKLYITNGPRTLFHPTNINDLLIRMGYRKIYCRLNVELSLFARLILYSRVQKWFNYLGIDKIFPGQAAKINSFFKLVEISKNF